MLSCFPADPHTDPVLPGVRLPRFLSCTSSIPPTIPAMPYLSHVRQRAISCSLSHKIAHLLRQRLQQPVLFEKVQTCESRGACDRDCR